MHAVDHVVIGVFRLVVPVLPPAVAVQLRHVTAAVVQHQEIPMGEPPQLEVSTVHNLHLFPGGREIVQCAVVPLILVQLRQRSLVGGVHEHPTRQPPRRPVALQEVQQIAHRVRWGQGNPQGSVVVHPLIQQDAAPQVGDAQEAHGDGVRTLLAVGRVQSSAELDEILRLALVLPVADELSCGRRGDDVALPVEVGEHQPRRPATQAQDLVLVQLGALRRRLYLPLDVRLGQT